jgi:dihydroflavonol-4-reductase
MKTVVTGASGHIGVNLVRALLSGGRDVRAFSHSSNRGLEDLPIEFATGDIRDIDSLIRAFQGADVVYHLAGHISLLMGDWKRCSDVNIEGTRNVIGACTRAGVKRLVHFSSIHSLCSEPRDKAIDESSQFVESLKSPPYDRSKAGGEKLVRHAVREGLNAIIINPTAVIGPYDYRPSHQGQALILMASGKLPMLLEGGFDWVDVRDVAEYAIKAQEIAPAGSSYLLSGHWLSVGELARMATAVTGRKPPAMMCPVGVAEFCAPIVTAASQLAGTRPIFTKASLNALKSNGNISHKKASLELGYNPRPIQETVVDTIKWFMDNGYIDKKRVRQKI